MFAIRQHIRPFGFPAYTRYLRSTGGRCGIDQWTRRISLARQYKRKSSAEHRAKMLHRAASGGGWFASDEGGHVVTLTEVVNAPKRKTATTRR